MNGQFLKYSEHRLKTPLTEADVRKLRVGDSVLLDGIIFGVRDGNLLRVFDKNVAARRQTAVD